MAPSAYAGFQRTEAQGPFVMILAFEGAPSQRPHGPQEFLYKLALLLSFLLLETVRAEKGTTPECLPALVGLQRSQARRAHPVA